VSHRLPAGTTAWLLSGGKIGHDVVSRGVLDALGVEVTVKPLRPRRVFASLAPWGPADPRGMATLIPIYPDLAMASGRQTVPFLRALKRASPGTFTVFMGDPRTSRHGADMIWAPRHDDLAGEDVLTTLTAPHPMGGERLAAIRAGGLPPDIAALPSPRVAVVIGGPSRHHAFGHDDQARLVEVVASLASAGAGLMVTPSRRTPPELLAAIRARLGPAAPAVVWDGHGDNPYARFLAFADAVLVTGDSTNMIGESCATGVPVHVFEPSGGHRKITGFVDHLVAAGVVRRWSGRLEHWTYQPIDSTHDVAQEVARRYAAFRHKAVVSNS
jgi:mitochondrial fission protein ELM1